MPTPDDTASATVIEAAPLFTLATRPKAEPHRFGPPTAFPPEVTPTRREQHERRCTACGLWRITIIGADEPRAYRWKDGPQFYADVGPECLPGDFTEKGGRP